MSAHAPTREDEAVARAMRLRPAPPRVMRLSRKALWLGGGILGCVGAGLLLFALRGGESAAPEELYRPAPPPPEAVNALPADYSGPRLGPPLPGDLGGAILDARRAEAEAANLGDDVASAPGAEAVNAEAAAASQAAERARQERDAARTSRLFIAAGRNTADTPPTELSSTTEGPDRVAGAFPSAPGTLWAGTIISGALVTGLRSDLPGAVLGQVTEDVFDSRTGRRLVIPKGSRLIGASGAEPANGQSRVSIRWSRLILPDGRSAALAEASASDPQGFAGLEDRVDNRWGDRLRAAGLTTLLSVSAAATGGDGTDRLARAIREGVGSGVDQTGREILNQQMQIPPRLTVRPGYPFRIILTEDLVLDVAVKE